MITDEDVFGCFGTTVNRDFFRSVVGDVLGAGVSRIVYKHKQRDDLVLKFEPFEESFQNVTEWEFWQTNKDDKKVCPWLAPCEFMSPCGMILMMKRTTPPVKAEYPRTLPAFLSDHKRTNFGMLDGRLVCHDYGFYNVKVPMRRKKVEWWDSQT